MGFWNALSVLAPVGPAVAQAQDIRVQRDEQERQDAQNYALNQERVKQAQQQTQRGNEPVIFGQPEWDSVSNGWSALAVTPQGGITRIPIPGGESPDATKQRQLDDAVKAYKQMTGQDITPEMKQALWGTIFGGSGFETGLERAESERAMAEYRQASLKVRQDTLALQKAKFDAMQDPTNPTTRAALARAQGDLMRDQAYMMRAQAGIFGTYNGVPLPGALETPSGTPVGSMFGGNFYKSSQGMAQLNDAQGAINRVKSAITSLYNSGSGLNAPNVAAALANPDWTVNQLIQGVAGKTLTPQEQEAVIAIKSARENIQGMRKAAGGGLSNEQVNRLEAQLPGPSTPNYAYASQQLGYLDSTLKRLSAGVPSTVGGPRFGETGGPPAGAVGTQMFTDGQKHYVDARGNDLGVAQ